MNPKSLLTVVGCLLAAGVSAQDFVSARMVSEREQPNYVLGTSSQRWASGQINWYYNPQGQPANGRAYYMGRDGVIQDLGPLSTYTPLARAAGY